MAVAPTNNKQTAHSIVALVIVVLVILAGLGLTAGFAVNWVFIALLATIGLLLLLGAASALAWPNAYKPIWLFGGALVFAGGIVASGFWPLIIPIIVTAGALLLLGLILKARAGEGHLLFGNWHLKEKGLGGSIFGDIANMLGVFAGIGAYRLVSGNPSLTKTWWWIGQFGAFLAAIVSISLLWRWANTPDLPNGQLNTNSSEYKQKWPALFNWAVAAFTIISLYAPTTSNYPLPGLTEQTFASLVCPGTQVVAGSPPECYVALNDNLGVVAGVWWLFLLSLLAISSFIMIGVGIKRGRFWHDHEDRAASVLHISITLGAIGAVIAAIINAKNASYWGDWGTGLGIVGVVAWIGGEFYNYIKLTQEWQSNDTFISLLDYLDWEKNFWEFVGGMGTILFLIGLIIISKQSGSFNWESFKQLNDVMFIVAAALGFLGTLRGILRGIMKRMNPRDPSTQQELRAVRLRTPVRQQAYTTALQDAAQERHQVQIRDGQIQNLQQNLAQCNANVQNLQQDIAQRDQAINTRKNHIDLLKFQIQQREQELTTLNHTLSQKDGEIEKLRKQIRSQ